MARDEDRLRQSVNFFFCLTDILHNCTITITDITIEMKIWPCKDIGTDHWHLPGHSDLCQYDSNCELTMNYNLA